MDAGRDRGGDWSQAWKDDLQPATLLLVGVPQLLADIIVARAARAGGVEVAGSVESARAVDALRRTGASLVISGDADAALVDELLGCRIAVDVVTLSGDGRDGTLHRLLPHHIELGELWLERLMAIARGADDTTKGTSTCQR